ncbi:monosaccharide ABC transporter substrate-binding protein, CUT2 family [Halanaerobium congolense]|jgi:ribose transport system substrate-binding protein|uniref:Monosaccharide ABC transporter substrate-binding protein, CUT2 family n=1 Tax=Halanaerobium congolense TaxID=54121 RepID=A0A1G8NWV1_9FIRM|nr:ABC transporter substrate-binding protein [Halanaerobium congolense]PUU89771.1 MAG: putative ABC transporter, periplasmic solute-binding protein [Halanaerobium sp.]TDP26415.1 monosaccharide ABC transporter substrate-binding protein (CUT2 family) [Halanaerobium congolense]SDI84635.1 monosaccharide ABC transporter substrate-binding protein, CUT2 family [Halanaerobium congolense]SET55083.1 monosaccharide ABC transporter substrate-binding protein, CUT2 family [Halanaerobium congolense]
MKKGLVIFVVLAMFLTLVFAGGVSAQDKHKIGILAPAVTHGWVAAVAYHAEARAEELSDKIEYRIQTSSNASEMTAQLDDLKTWGAEAIVAFPQWTGMEVPIRMAIEDGIEVVNFDIKIDVDGVYRVAGDNYDMGVQGAHYIADKIGKEGTVVVLEVPTAGSVSELRKAGFLDTLEKIGADYELHTYATQFTREAGLNDMSDILVRHDHIDAVYSMDDETSIGVLKAIEEAGRKDIKVVTGGGGMQEYFEMMPKNKDIWIQSALYSPAMVKDAVDVAVKVLEGEEVPQETIIPTTIVDRTNYKKFLDPNSPY